MKKSPSFSKALLVSLASAGFFATPVINAFAGSGTSGGGDATTARKVDLSKNFVFLKADLKNFLESLDVGTLKDSAVKAILIDITDRGLKDDIEKSAYQLSDKCSDEAQMDHAASTVIGVRNADICFDLGKMSAQNTLPGELLGLAIHEHAHHFGYQDSEDLYRLITLVANQYAENKAKQVFESIANIANPNMLDKKTRAHTTTWNALFSLNQIQTHFAQSGSISISSFPEVGAGAVTRETIGLATQLDRIFVNGRGAKRNKTGINYPVLIASILKDGAKEEKNIRWFADQIDALYTFWQE